VEPEREWELTFDTIEAPMAVVQLSDFTVRRANRAYARAAGAALEVKELPERPRCFRYLFQRETPCPACPITRGAASGQAELSSGGKVYVLSVNPIDETGNAVCSYRDVTEERGITRRLMETEKMVAVGNLAGGVAHEINNPLGGILAFCQLMQRDPGRSSSDLEALMLMEESALRCKRIVDSLLKFSRRSRTEDRRPLNLSACMEDAALLFRAQLKRYPKVELTSDLQAGLPSVYGDPGQLAQVVLNLLQNALQALPAAGGRLSLTTGQREGHCTVTVTDNGSGIPAEVLPHIFEPHFTTKPAGEGTGLGLAIAYGIVKDHGGEIEVQTQPERGSTFTVLVPAMQKGTP
jgi:two-component system NtrC family sensor kinase